ncbi:sulfatase [Streptomyces bathyalis]|uniref:Sulfatase n=1 Tax=Streptomyces bathyalis TaxID=2710756 RepID=A0A7T1T7F6_9ACTN|nr:sulfatase [Streptomyces bathyalis]QPP07805.1 sulfatase [Streptomyces bathyalis]
MSLFTRSLRQQRNKDKEDTEKGVNPEAGTGSAAAATTDGTTSGTTTDGTGTGTNSTDADAAESTGCADAPESTDAADAPGADDASPGADAPDASAGDGGDGSAGAGSGGGWRGRHPAAARAVSVTTTVLAAALVLAALLLPNALMRLTPSAFARIPVEGIFGAVVLLVLPPRVRRWAAVLAGALLGLVTILKFIDMGFYEVLARPFDLVLDWILFDDANSFLKDTLGRTGAVVALVGIVILALSVVVFMALAVRRLSRIMSRHSVATGRAALALGTVWIVCAVFGLQTGDHVNVASRNTALLVQHRVKAVKAGMEDEKAFAKESRVDRFDGTPGDKLVPALRGKNVIFTFIESYGRSAIEDPEMAPGVNSVLADRTKALDDAGFSSKSGWLTSPISGAGSWMGHSTLMSGLWIANQQRYRSVTSNDRLTITRAFRRTGDYRMVGIMPGVRRSWPEAKFYGMDHVYDSRQLGYKGPYFSWSPVPDQFSLKAFERLEHSKADHKPLMATIILASSHNPWSPLPTMLPWDELGDGSVYKPIHDAGARPTEVWKDPHRVRAQYRKAIEYSVQSLTEYMEKYADKDTVLVFLGDHQPVPTVTSGSKNKDVPISIVAKDKKVMDKISGWGWNEGLKPDHKAPVWRMDKFRDRFLTAYGSEPESSSKSGSE